MKRGGITRHSAELVANRGALCEDGVPRRALLLIDAKPIRKGADDGLRIAFNLRVRPAGGAAAWHYLRARCGIGLLL